MSITLRDVAADTGLAVSTISNVLNGNRACFASVETQQRIREAAQRLGYRPNFFARRLRRQRSQLIGVAGGLFGSELRGLQLSGIESSARARGYRLYFADTRADVGLERAMLEDFAHLQVEGILLWTLCGPESRPLPPPGIATVLLPNRACPGNHYLLIDRSAAYEHAVDHLAAQGHRRIAFLGHQAGNPEKVAGFRAGLRRHGIDPEGLVQHIPGDRGDALADILGRPDFYCSVTAIIASNDRLAIEAITALRRLGRTVPGDCSVIGFDDADVATAIEPPLTTMRQPRAAVGEVAIAMLFALLDGQQPPPVTLVPPLIVRGSTALAPA